VIAYGKAEEVIKFAADTVLESYRNSVEVGAKADKDDLRIANRFV
jgi:hypothetical protein